MNTINIEVGGLVPCEETALMLRWRSWDIAVPTCYRPMIWQEFAEDTTKSKTICYITKQAKRWSCDSIIGEAKGHANCEGKIS